VSVYSCTSLIKRNNINHSTQPAEHQTADSYQRAGEQSGASAKEQAASLSGLKSEANRKVP